MPDPAATPPADAAPSGALAPGATPAEAPPPVARSLDAPAVAPAAAPPGGPPVFEIGLVAAGAVSAGAYTAGVLDLLFEAMDAWQAAKDAEAEGRPGAVPVPTHEVALRAIVGASAGAMNAAIVAAWAGRGFGHVGMRNVHDPAAIARNPFAFAWIASPDIARLLDPGDLAGGGLPSVLNGTWLRDVVDQVLSPDGQGGLEPPQAAPRRPWLADLRVRLTVGNLTGTPYLLRFDTSGEVAGGMMDHAEVLDFQVVPPGGAAAKALSHYLPLRSAPSRADAGWSGLGDAALASGAFPAALPARGLRRETPLRSPRLVFVPSGDPARPNEGVWQPLSPAWDELGACRDALLCVDGGIANNEPIDLCREALLLKPGSRLPRPPAEATQAMIMIDPFPDVPKPGPCRADAALPRVLGALVTAWKNQARFRPVDIELATRGDAFSRQLIAPKVEGGDRPAGAPPLAGAALGGFFGFFDRRFREHDYLLGRHNARGFLQKHFCVPVANPVVAPWACGPDGQPTELAQAVMRDHGLDPAKGCVPLVWLPPHLRAGADPKDDPVPQPAWPKGRFEPAVLRAPMAARARAVLRAAAFRAGLGWQAAAAATGWLVARWLAGKAVAALTEARDRSGLGR